MIEQMRKYSGLMIVVLVIVFISFFFMDTRSMQGLSGGAPVMKIDGRGYSEKDVRVNGAGAYDLVVEAAQGGDFGFYQAFIPLFGRATSREDVPLQFFVGRTLLHDAQEQFGIYPSDEEIASYIRKMRLFAGPDGAFNQESYRNFIEKTINRMGMTEKDLRALASDAIVAQKLQSIVGSGLGADRETVARTMALDNQQITAELGSLKLDTFQDKIEPTEEEIKTFWEGVQESFKTEPLRKFSYVLVTPPPTAETPVETTSDTIADAAASDEAKAAAAKAAEEKKAAAAAKTAEERRKNQIATDRLVDDFVSDLQDAKGTGFEELAKKNGWEIKTTELIGLSNPPADLNLDLRSTSTPGKVITSLFKISPGTDAFSKISEALPVGDGQWLVARLDGEEKARVKTFAEARADARAQYISEKGIEALKAATEEAATKIKEALAAGKPFAEAAKEAGIAETKTVEKIDSAYRPDPMTEPQTLFETVRSTDPGSLANTIIESDRSFLVYVVKREVVKEPNADARLDAEVKSRASENQMAAFDSWLTARIDTAKVENLFKKN